MKTIYVKLKPFKLIVEWLTLLGFSHIEPLSTIKFIYLFYFFKGQYLSQDVDSCLHNAYILYHYLLLYVCK